ncbi:protein kish-B isoform X1 [Erinaceus europaeus]|uniref:Protein kish-B n=1 Tax=Erinaceus europaeus TaxID=9365 RepID=A0ABM3YA43_ERIEU|nr:protein kish-B isoform X1 [Erinaceus europaeus]
MTNVPPGPRRGGQHRGAAAFPGGRGTSSQPHLSSLALQALWVDHETAVYSLDGILVFGLLFVCTCAYFKKVPRLKTWLLSEKKGVWGVFYKAAVIGTRLHAAVAIACVVMAFYVLFIK